MSATRLMLAAVCPAGTLESAERSGYEPSQRARVFPLGPFEALAVEVPEGYIEGDEGEARLRDVAWLGHRAQRHDELVRFAMRAGPTLPAGFASLFSGPEALGAVLAAHAEEICAHFEHTADCEEWSIRLITDRPALVERELDKLIGDAGTGSAYLARKRLLPQAQGRADEWCLQRADELLEALGETIIEASERPLASARRDDARDVVSHDAVLVHKDDLASFEAALDAVASALEAHGVDIELTGPWPVFSFCPALTSPDDASESVQPSSAETTP